MSSRGLLGTKCISPLSLHGKEPSCVNNTKTPPLLQKEWRCNRWETLSQENITLKVSGILTSGDGIWIQVLPMSGEQLSYWLWHLWCWVDVLVVWLSHCISQLGCREHQDNSGRPLPPSSIPCCGKVSGESQLCCLHGILGSCLSPVISEWKCFSSASSSTEHTHWGKTSTHNVLRNK